MGGLGEAVARLLMRKGVMPARFRMLALPDAFLDAGALPTLHDRYGISAEKMAASIKSCLKWPVFSRSPARAACFCARRRSPAAKAAR